MLELLSEEKQTKQAVDIDELIYHVDKLLETLADINKTGIWTYIDEDLFIAFRRIFKMHKKFLEFYSSFSNVRFILDVPIESMITFNELGRPLVEMKKRILTPYGRLGYEKRVASCRKCFKHLDDGFYQYKVFLQKLLQNSDRNFIDWHVKNETGTPRSYYLKYLYGIINITFEEINDLLDNQKYIYNTVCDHFNLSKN